MSPSAVGCHTSSGRSTPPTGPGGLRIRVGGEGTLGHVCLCPGKRQRTRKAERQGILANGCCWSSQGKKILLICLGCRSPRFKSSGWIPNSDSRGKFPKVLGPPSWSERPAKALSGPRSKDTRLRGFYFNLLPPPPPSLSTKCRHPGFGDRELTAPRTAGPFVLRSSPCPSPVGLAHWSWL